MWWRWRGVFASALNIWSRTIGGFDALTVPSFVSVGSATTGTVSADGVARRCLPGRGGVFGIFFDGDAAVAYGIPSRVLTGRKMLRVAGSRGCVGVAMCFLERASLLLCLLLFWRCGFG